MEIADRDEGSNYKIEFADKEEWEDAMALAWKTFLIFEANEYTPEGVRNFENFITDTGLKQMFLMGTYQMMTAYDKKRMVGMITLRNEMHISLLFVDREYHRRGIGRALVEKMAVYVRDELGKSRMTVNASPYGVPFYHKIGFRNLGEERQRDGILYTPMEYLIENRKAW